MGASTTEGPSQLPAQDQQDLTTPRTTQEGQDFGLGQMQPAARLGSLFRSLSRPRSRPQTQEEPTQAASISQIFNLSPPNANMPDKLDKSVYDRLQALGGGPRSTTSKTTTTDPDALLHPPPKLRDNPETQPTLPLLSHTGSNSPNRTSDTNDPMQEPQNHPPDFRRSSTDKDSRS